MTIQTYVFNGRTYKVHLSDPSKDLEALLTLSLDRYSDWSLTVPSWGGVSFSATNEFAYLWSARQLVILPQTTQEQLSLIELEEDLLAALSLRAGGSWSAR